MYVCVGSSSVFVLSETRLSRQRSIPSQIRNLTSDPSYSSASGQCKAAHVTQIGREQLSKWWMVLHECVRECVWVKVVGEGYGGIKGEKKDKREE